MQAGETVTVSGPRALAAGIASGAISALLLFAIGDTDIGFFLPGIVFGVVTGLASAPPGWRLAVWCLASTLAWCAAVAVFIMQVADANYLFSDAEPTLTQQLLPWMLAGGTGATVLVAGRWAIYRTTPRLPVWLPIAVGAAVPLLMNSVPSATGSARGVEGLLGGIVSFAAWQGAVGWSLLPAMRTRTGETLPVDQMRPTLK